MPGCSHGLAYPEVQSVVVGQNAIRWVDPMIGHVFKRVGFQKSIRKSQAFSHPSTVVWMLEITVVKGRLYSGVGRCQPDVS